MTEVNDQLVSEFVQLLTSPCDFDDRLRAMNLLTAHPKEADIAFARVEQGLRELQIAVKNAAARK